MESIKTFLLQTAHNINCYLEQCPEHLRDNKAHKDLDNLLNLICRIGTVHSDNQFAPFPNICSSATSAPSGVTHVGVDTSDVSTPKKKVTYKDLLLSDESNLDGSNENVLKKKAPTSTSTSTHGSGSKKVYDEVKDAWKNRGKKKSKHAKGLLSVDTGATNAEATDAEDAVTDAEDAVTDAEGFVTENEDAATTLAADGDVDAFPTFTPFAEKHRLKHMLP